MAQRLTVELDDHEMRKIEAAAQANQLDLKSMTAKQLVLALAMDGSAAETKPDSASTEARRAKRLAAVMSMHGIWKDDPSKPKDPVAYQREVRAEWQ